MEDQNYLKRKVKEAAGCAPWTVLFCPDCSPNQIIAETFEAHWKYPWGLTLHCGTCSSSWTCCTKCTSQRVHLITSIQINRHNRQRHLKAIPVPTETTDTTSPMETEKRSTRVQIPNTFFPRSASTHFFTNEQEGNGARCLVSKAVFSNIAVAHQLSKEDVEMFMTLAFFVNGVTRTQREQLALVLNQVVNAMIRRTKPIPSIRRTKPIPSSIGNAIWNVPIPISKERIRATICEGKNCIRTNLPHPKIYTDIEVHAYLKPSECVADCLAHGLLDGRSSAHDYESLSESPLARAIHAMNKARGIRSIFLSFWCDDFEPNNMKDNRGSVWMQTLSIETIDSGDLTVHHVYPISVGPKIHDHYEAMRATWDDVKKLNSVVEGISMYNGAKKQMEVVSCHVLSVVMDQPECRAVNGLLLGGSTSMSRFGYTIDLSQFVSKIRPCSDCWHDLLVVDGDDEWKPRSCDRCINWMSCPPDTLQYKPPTNYPVSQLNDGRLKCQKLTYDYLKEKAEFCHEKVTSGEWTTTIANVYLTAVGFKTSLATKIIKCAENIRASRKALEKDQEQSTAETRELLETIAEDGRRQPWMYSPCELPPIWDSNLAMEQCPQATMHILFLGMGKKIVMWIQAWSVCRKKYTSLRKALLVKTQKVGKLGLSWLKVQPYKGKKLGGWVSENFLGYVRIMPWMYGSLSEIANDPSYEEPERERHRWNKKENLEWLRSRNLQLHGNAKEIKERVKDNYGKPEAEPFGSTVDHIRKLILSLSCMVSHLMGMKSSSAGSVNVADRLIHIYLTFAYDHIEAMGLEEESKPAWLASYNFVCLLNIPEQIRLLGPIRNRWEGGARGEGYLRRVKSAVYGTSRKHWDRNLLTNLMQQNTISLITRPWNEIDLPEILEIPESPEDTNEDDDDSSASSASSDSDLEESKTTNANKPDLTSFKVYPCRAEVLSQLTKDEPLSVVLSESNGTNETAPVRVYVVFLEGSVRLVLELVCGDISSSKFGFHYHQYTVPVESTRQELAAVPVSSYGILLPKPQSSIIEMYYALVDDKWRVLDSNKSLVHPHKYMGMEYN
jgi:hypothetical protein